MAEKPAMKTTNIVLVHGGFVDGSGWEGVYKILTKDGYRVSIVQNPVAGSHAIYVSQPKAVAAFIEKAAGGKSKY